METTTYTMIAKTILSGMKMVDAKLPDWILLFSDGWVTLEGDGKFLVDRKAFDLVTARMARRGVDIVVDYEHQTLKENEAPAAGWIRELRYEEGNGIIARVDWTEAATKYILNGEYRYFSPVFMTLKSDNRLAALHSVALTNAPKTNDLKPILAKEPGGVEMINQAKLTDKMLEIAKMMGVSEEDLAKYSGVMDETHIAKTDSTKISNTTLKIAAMMGVTQEDIVKYG